VGGEAFITAELLAGKNALAPIPLITLATTTSHRPVPRQVRVHEQRNDLDRQARGRGDNRTELVGEPAGERSDR